MVNVSLDINDRVKHKKEGSDFIFLRFQDLCEKAKGQQIVSTEGH